MTTSTSTAAAITPNNDAGVTKTTMTESNIDSDYFPCPYSSDTSEYIQLDDINENVKSEENPEEQYIKEDEHEHEHEDDSEKLNNTEAEVLNVNDTDENKINDKIYIISINGIPYYYEKTLLEARTQMMDLANFFVGNLNNTQGAGHLLITDNNLKKVKIIAPYNFLMLTYNYVIHEITLEYAIKRENEEDKDNQ